MNTVIPPILAAVLATALFGMVTRLIVPLIRGEWRTQTEQVTARVLLLTTTPLPLPRRRHAKRKFGRAA